MKTAKKKKKKLPGRQTVASKVGRQIRQKKFAVLNKEALQSEAKLLVAAAGEVKRNPKYKTLTYGLKKNHPRNVAVLYPILYLLRRVLYTIAILFITQIPFIGVVILMFTCVTMLALLASEAQWKDPRINNLHVINEVAFYLVLLHFIAFCGLVIEA